MSTVFRFTEPSLSEDAPEKAPIKLLKFTSDTPETSVCKAAKVLQLEEQVRALREELTRAQRQLTQYESLLQNARLREQELRAELLKKK